MLGTDNAIWNLEEEIEEQTDFLTGSVVNPVQKTSSQAWSL